MSELFRDLYETLLNGIEKIDKENPDLRTQIEKSFHLCETFRRRVDEAVSGTTFRDEAEEIDFFRNVKPRFTHLVEFYSTLYRAELFTPESTADQIEFWNAELHRAESFLERHANLYHYIRSGEQSNDRKYFLRDTPDGISAMHCELIAKLLAKEKYIDYIKTKILPGYTNVNP